MSFVATGLTHIDVAVAHIPGSQLGTHPLRVQSERV